MAPKYRDEEEKAADQETQKQEDEDTGNTNRGTENQQEKKPKQRKNKRTTQEHTKEPKQSFGRSSITPPSPKSESKPGEQKRRRAREQERFASSRPGKFFLFPTFQIHFTYYFAKFWIERIDIHDKRWRFRCCTRQKTELITLNQSCLHEVGLSSPKKRDLKKGDEVTFSVVDMKGAEDLELAIQARKRIKLFGQDFWSNPL
ncbi:hypothetical protein NC651_007912 [Populus alba x Populus x berolinensis]|nr:hypothetical protein NC651_007912 [Populus alba x Populus x berolinensis]